VTGVKPASSSTRARRRRLSRRKQGDELVLNLGYSHPIRFKPPQGISIDVQDPTKFSVSGISIEDVGQVAASPGSPPPSLTRARHHVPGGEKVRRKAGRPVKGQTSRMISEPTAGQPLKRHKRVRVTVSGSAGPSRWPSSAASTMSTRN